MAIPRSSMSPLEHQQFQRLKVNRIAVIQELKVDHILSYLLARSVLNQTDLIEIEKCRTTTEKSKRLLDILPTKGRASNWYKHFRAALLNPSVDDSVVKHKYQILVEFLDNTIIDQMSHPVRLTHKICNTEQMSTFPRYQPLPGIANNSSRPPTIAGAAVRKPTQQLNHNEHYLNTGAAAAAPAEHCTTNSRVGASKLNNAPISLGSASEELQDLPLSSRGWSMRRLQGES